MPGHTWGAHGESPRNFFGMQVLGWVCGCLHAGRYRVSCITKPLGNFPEVGGNYCPNLRELMLKPHRTQLQIFRDLKTKKAANKNNNRHHLPVLKMAFSSVPAVSFWFGNKRDVSYVGGRAKVLLDVSLFELEPLSTAATTSSLQFRCGRRWANEFHVSKESMVELPRKPHVVVLYASPVKNTHRIHGCRTVYFTYMKAIHVSPTCTDQIHRSSHGWIRFMGKNNLLRMGILAYQPFTLINSCFWFPE